MLTIGYMNIRSIRNKFEELQCYLRLHRCHILTITETWLSEDEVQFFELQGYRAVHSCREGRGGGTSLFVCDEIGFEVMDIIGGISPCNIIRIKLCHVKLQVLAVYRPPGFDIGAFQEVLYNLLHSCKGDTVVIGDMNVDLLKPDAAELKEYLDTVTICGFRVANNVDEENATRVTSDSTTLIDHVLINNQLNCKVTVLDYAMSDHNCLGIELYRQRMFRKKTVRTCYRMDERLYRDNLAEILSGHVVESFADLIYCIQQAKTLSTREIRLRIREGGDWISPELLSMIRERNKLYRLLKTYPCDQRLLESFAIQKKKVDRERRHLKASYFSSRWKKTGSSAKKQWQLINSLISENKSRSTVSDLLVDGQLITDHLAIASVFNEYFAAIGHEISSMINLRDNLADPVNYLEVGCSNSAYLNPVTAAELEEVIAKLKCGSSAGSDQVRASDLIIVKEFMVPILTRLINDVFETGIFPEVLKICRVTPIHKNGALNEKINYRPITVVSVFSKIIEHVLKKRMVSFIDRFVEFDRYQYGFTENSNTQSATVDLVSYINTRLDSREYVVAVFVDLQKAFDVVSHEVLLGKLQLMGFRGKFLSLIETYLVNRSQFVAISDVSSSTLYINCGVPQGSVLGPLLYTLYVLNLRLAGLTARYFTFADDTVLVYSSPDISRLSNIVNHDLSRYAGWLRHNKLKLNDKKTVYMLFRQKNTPNHDLDIRVNEIKICKVESVKYLGLIMDGGLNWGKHIDHLHKKIVPMCGALYRCAQYLNSNNRFLIYNAFVVSHLRYLITIWGCCGSVAFRRAQVLQNRVVKVLFQFENRTHTETLYRVLQLLPLRHILELEQCKQVYKTLTNSLKCNSEFVFVSQLHSHDTRAANDIHLPVARTNKSLNNPLFRAFEVYNSLPLSIKSNSSYGRFLAEVKAFLSARNYI